MKKINYILSAGLILFFLSSFSCSGNKNPQEENIVGAWKGKVQFKSGVFAEVKDFEFMYVFNSGGTMTESSNYDGVPPTPPAYGVWKKTGANKYEARYEFYWNKVPASYEELIKEGGFVNTGYGVLSEKITLAADGKSFTSVINYSSFDKTGKLISSGDEAVTEVKRMEF